MLDSLFACSYALMCTTLFLQRQRLSQFLARTPSISGAAVFDSYKALGRIEMYQALVQIVFGIGAIITSFIMVRRYFPIGILAVFVFNAVVVAIALLNKRLEQRARGLEVAPEFADEYQKVSKTWIKAALPNF